MPIPRQRHRAGLELLVALGLAGALAAGCSLPNPIPNQLLPARNFRLGWQAGTVLDYTVGLQGDAPDTTGKMTHVAYNGSGSVTVTSIDRSGVATVQVKLTIERPGSTSGSSTALYVLHVTSTGRIVDNPDGLAGDLINEFVIVPMLPPGPVRVGDLWHETYNLPGALIGAYRFVTTGKYVRDETLAGTPVVLIQTHMVASIDWSFAYAKYFGPPPPPAPQSINVHDVGNVVADTSFWYDPAKQTPVKNKLTSHYEFNRTYIDASNQNIYSHEVLTGTDKSVFTATA